MNKIILTNVKVGMKFSTESKLLDFLGFEKKSGKAQVLQKKELSRYLAYEKTGKISRGKETNEIIITEIFETLLDKEDGRINNGRAKGLYGSKIISLCKRSKISLDDIDKKGVYAICYEDEIYIGSTITSFRKRILQHMSLSNESTHDIVKKDFALKILKYADGYNEYQIREMEEEFILTMWNQNLYELLNRNDKTWSFGR